MSEQLGEANGFAHAYSTWISQGNGLDTKRDGVFRYKAGPMKGMTRDQAQMHFQNTVWKNAAPEWKNEYAKRATSDLLAPSEQSDLEKRKAFASPITQPQYQPAATAVAPMQNDGVVAPVAVQPPASITPPTFSQKQAAAQQRNAASVAKTVQAMKGEPPAGTPAGKFDLMKADYSTLTPEQKAQRTQANVNRAKSMETTESMPAMSVTAPRMKPMETKYEMAKGRVVQTGGDATEEFANYDKAQNAANAGTATAGERKTVTDFVGQDVLGRQPDQVAKLRDDERKGYYQAGRYVGPPKGAMPVQRPVFAGRQPITQGANPAPVATRQPSFGNRSGTGATRMPI